MTQKNVKAILKSNHLSSFWTTLEMALINSKTNLTLPWYANCFIITGAIDNQVPTFTVGDTKLCVSFVTLSTQNNAKLL